MGCLGAAAVCLLAAALGLGDSLEFDIGQPPAAACLGPSVGEALAKCGRAKGNGGGAFRTLWSFEKATGKCRSRSLASDCRPDTPNQFTTSAECSATCFHARCLLEPSGEACVTEGPAEFWLYNAANGSCIPYPTNACPLSANAFTSQAQCYTACFRAPCSVGRVVAECEEEEADGGFDRFAYEPFAGKCEKFRLPNCPHKAVRLGHKPRLALNHFLSHQECQRLCECDESEAGCPGPLESLFSRTIGTLVEEMSRRSPAPKTRLPLRAVSPDLTTTANKELVSSAQPAAAAIFHQIQAEEIEKAPAKEAEASTPDASAVTPTEKKRQFLKLGAKRRIEAEESGGGKTKVEAKRVYQTEAPSLPRNAALRLKLPGHFSLPFIVATLRRHFL